MDWSRLARACDRQLPLERAASAAAIALADPRTDDVWLDTGTGTAARRPRMLCAPLAAAADSYVGPRRAFRPLHPRAELEAASFTVAAARYVARGYPSNCLSATH